jgi:hypothetical protein
MPLYAAFTDWKADRALLRPKEIPALSVFGSTMGLLGAQKGAMIVTLRRHSR